MSWPFFYNTGICAFAFHNGKNLFVYSIRGIAATCGRGREARLSYTISRDQSCTLGRTDSKKRKRRGKIESWQSDPLYTHLPIRGKVLTLGRNPDLGAKLGSEVGGPLLLLNSISYLCSRSNFYWEALRGESHYWAYRKTYSSAPRLRPLFCTKRPTLTEQVANDGKGKVLNKTNR